LTLVFSYSVPFAKKKSENKQKSQNHKNMLIFFANFTQKTAIKFNITGLDLLTMVYFSIFRGLKSQKVGKI